MEIQQPQTQQQIQQLQNVQNVPQIIPQNVNPGYTTMKFYEKKAAKLGGVGGRTVALSGIERQIAAAAAATAVDPITKRNFETKYRSGAKRDVTVLMEKRKAKGKNDLNEDKKAQYLSLPLYQQIGAGIFDVVKTFPQVLHENIYVDRYGMIYAGMKNDGSRNYFSKKLYRDLKWANVTDPGQFQVKAALRLAAAYNFFIRSIRQYQRISENAQVEFDNFIFRKKKNAEPGLSLYRRNLAAAKRYGSQTYDQLLRARRAGLQQMVAKAANKAQKQFEIINADAAGFTGVQGQQKYEPPAPIAPQQYGGQYVYPQQVQYAQFNPLEFFGQQQGQQQQ